MKTLVVLLVLIAARPADACKWVYHSMFLHYDDAAAVVRAKMRAPGGRRALAVLSSFKGKPPRQVKIPTNPCFPVERGTGIAFLDENMKLIDGGIAFVIDKENVAALTTYAAARTHADRAAVLVDLALDERETRLVQYAAEVALASDPKLLAAITDAQRDRIVANVERLREDSFLLVALARLGMAAKLLKGPAADLASARTFETLAKPDELAAILDQIPKGQSVRGVAALERCERLRGKRLTPNFYQTLDDGMIPEEYDTLVKIAPDWHELAERCRTGN